MKNLILVVLLCSCSEEASQTPVSNFFKAEVDGFYMFFPNEYENTCDPKGPRHTAPSMVLSQIDGDGFGQVSFTISGIQLSFEVTENEHEYTLSLIKNNCFFIGDYNSLDGTCNQNNVVPNFNAVISKETNRFKGELVANYFGVCGADGGLDGVSKVKYDGNHESFPTTCKVGSFYCYSETNCKGKLPWCKISPEFCREAKSYRVVGQTECFELEEK